VRTGALQHGYITSKVTASVKRMPRPHTPRNSQETNGRATEEDAASVWRRMRRVCMCRAARATSEQRWIEWPGQGGARDECREEDAARVYGRRTYLEPSECAEAPMPAAAIWR
jgi:hypothetical protein